MSFNINTTTKTFKAGKYAIVAPNQALSGSGTVFSIGDVVELVRDSVPDGEGDLLVRKTSDDGDIIESGYVHFESLAPVGNEHLIREIIGRLESLEERLVAAAAPEEPKIEFTNQGIYRVGEGRFVVKDSTGRTFFTIDGGGWIEVGEGQYDDQVIEKIDISSL